MGGHPVNLQSADWPGIFLLFMVQCNEYKRAGNVLARSWRTAR